MYCHKMHLSLSLRALVLIWISYVICVTKATTSAEKYDDGYSLHVRPGNNTLNTLSSCSPFTISIAEALLKYNFIDVISVMNGLKSVIQNVKGMKDIGTSMADMSLMHHIIEVMIVASFDHLSGINDVYLSFNAGGNGGNLSKQHHIWKRVSDTLTKVQSLQECFDLPEYCNVNISVNISNKNIDNNSNSNNNISDIYNSSNNNSISNNSNNNNYNFENSNNNDIENNNNNNNTSHRSMCLSIEEFIGVVQSPSDLDNNYAWNMLCHHSDSYHVRSARLLTSFSLRKFHNHSGLSDELR